MDGLNALFQVNYLGHFLLTYLLIPSLRLGAQESEPARVVNVCGWEWCWGKLKLEERAEDWANADYTLADTKVFL